MEVKNKIFNFIMNHKIPWRVKTALNFKRMAVDIVTLEGSGIKWAHFIE